MVYSLLSQSDVRQHCYLGFVILHLYRSLKKIDTFRVLSHCVGNEKNVLELFLKIILTKILKITLEF